MTTQSHRRWTLGIAVVVLIASAVYMLAPRSYGETSKEGYRFAVALFSACNQKDVAKLKKVDVMVTAASQAGDIGSDESKWLRAIVERGLAGQWGRASRDIRRLMEDQLRAASLGDVKQPRHKH